MGNPGALDTDVPLSVLSVSPLGLPGQEGKPCSAFQVPTERYTKR